MIVGSNNTKEEIYNGVYKYTCEDGYHFESCGTNYGQSIYGTAELTNKYVIKKENG